MANVNVVSFLEGTQTTQPYYPSAGVQDGTINYGIIPTHSVGLTLALSTQVLGNAINAQLLVRATRDHTEGEFISLLGERFVFGVEEDLPLEQAFFPDAFQQAVNANATLGPQYTARVITLGSNTFCQIIAREPGSQYNLVVGDTVDSSGGFNFSTQTSATANRGQQISAYDYRVYAEIYTLPLELGRRLDPNNLPSTTLVERVTRLELGYQPGNTYEFDAGPYLRPFTEIPFPETPYAYSNNFVKVADPQAFFIAYGEAFRGGLDYSTGNPINDADNITDNRLRSVEVGTTDIAWAMPGALDAGPVDTSSPAPDNQTPYQKYTQRWNGFNVATLPLLGLHGLLRKSSIERSRRTVQRSLAPALRYTIVINVRDFSNQPKYRLKTVYRLVNGDEYTLFSSEQVIPMSGVYGVDASSSLYASDVEGFYGVPLDSWEVYVELNPFGNAGNLWIEGVLLDACRMAPSWASAPLDYESRVYTLYWRNPFGAFDQFDFPQTKTRSFDISPVQYERASTPSQVNTLTRHERTSFVGAGELEMELLSGWVGPDEYEWLRQCLRAPQHWVFEPRNTFRAVQVLSAEWEENKADNEYRLSVVIRKSVPEAEITA